MAKQDMKTRDRALYVEIAPNGAPMTPEGVDEESTRSWLSGMIGLFVTLGMTWRGSIDDALAVAKAGGTQNGTSESRSAATNGL